MVKAVQCGCKMKEQSLSESRCPGVCGLEYHTSVKRGKGAKKSFKRAVKKNMSVKKVIQIKA